MSVDGARCGFYGPRYSVLSVMNAKLLLKLVFIIVMLFLLVLIGLSNRQPVSFVLPPILNKSIQQPGAIMYFAFFAVGVLTGAVLTTGGKKGGSSAGKSSSSSK